MSHQQRELPARERRVLRTRGSRRIPTDYTYRYLSYAKFLKGITTMFAQGRISDLLGERFVAGAVPSPRRAELRLPSFDLR